MHLDFDFGQVHRALALIEETPLTTGRSLWCRIGNEQAFVLEAVWAPAAQRTIPRLQDQQDQTGFDDVVATLRDLVRLEGTLAAALAKEPPDEVTDASEVSSTSSRLKLGRPIPITGTIG